MLGHVWTHLLSLMLSCDVWISPVEGALPYAEAPSTLHHCSLQHLLPTCAEYKFHFQTLRRVVFFQWALRPHPSLLWLFTQFFITIKLLDVKVKWGNITWFQNAIKTRFLLTSALPYVFSMLHIALQTDNDELFVFDALFYSLQCQLLSPCLV